MVLTAHTLRPVCVLGAFFAEKKKGRSRLIVDCRKANALFASPPPAELSGDGQWRIEVDASGLVHGKYPGLHYGCADVADCFHMVCLAFFLCWPGVWNRYFKMTEIEGTKVSPN